MAMRPAWAHLEPDGLVPAIVTEASPGSSTITVAARRTRIERSRRDSSDLARAPTR